MDSVNYVSQMCFIVTYAWACHSLNSCFQLNTVQFKLTFVTSYKMFSYLRSSVAEAEKLISHEAGGVKQTINNWQ